MKADKYVVSLYNASTDILIVNETIVPGEQNHLDVYNLINEYKYACLNFIYIFFFN